VSHYLGGRLAARLSSDSDVDRVIGIDTIPPRPEDRARLGRTEFVRADIRNPLIAKVIAQARVDTVVHTAPSAGLHAPQALLPDQHVTGTMQLLAACQTSEWIARVVVASTTAVYGSSARDPAAFTEAMQPASRTAQAYARQAIEVENYTRGFARRRPDIGATVLRLATMIGPTIQTALTRYLSMPIVPTPLGFDPRLQLLHEDDACEVLRRATLEHHPGVYNVAGDGVMPLSQVLRWAGRIRLAVPAAAISVIGGLAGNSGVIDFSAEQASFLRFGRVVDTARLRTEFGFAPRYSTTDAVRSYLAGRAGRPRLGVAAVVGAEHLVEDRVRRFALGHADSEVH